jgi:hypothetical protein
MSKALQGAERKGREAAGQGKPRICPYEDKRTSYHNGVTFSEAFRKAWFAGYDSVRREGDNEPH